MRKTMTILLVLLMLAPGLPASAVTGSLSLDAAQYTSGVPVKAAYRTDQPTDRNWVGVYSDPGNAPVDGKYVGPSTVWDWAPGASGSVSIPTKDLTPGAYVAYYLHDNGYTSLAAPVRFRVVGSGRSPEFLADPAALRNARVGTAYSAKVPAIDPDGTALTFRKVSGPAWAAVSAAGAVTGTPTAEGTASIAVEATDGEGRTTRGTVTVTVRPATGRLVPDPVIGAFNVWIAGTRVDDGRTKDLRVLARSGVDAIGLSETTSGHAQSLADTLGWYWANNSDLAVLSKYPITETFKADKGFGARVEFAPKETAIVWDAHLNYTPYGPYDACYDKMTVDRLIARERESGRVKEIEGILKAMAPHLAAKDPLFLVGDFNAPSHLDWTREAASTHCGYTVPWPVSTAIADAGLTDSYRTAHPDPVTDPGNTWSPVYPKHDGATGVDEPQDRIDFVYAANATTRSSHTLVFGTPTPVPNHKTNDWPSDHAAVISHFTVG